MICGVKCRAEVHSKYRSCWLILASDMISITLCSCNAVFFSFLKPSCALLRVLKCHAHLYRHSAITHVHNFIEFLLALLASQIMFATHCIQEHCLRFLPCLGRCSRHSHQGNCDLHGATLLVDVWAFHSRCHQD